MNCERRALKKIERKRIYYEYQLALPDYSNNIVKITEISLKLKVCLYI